MCTCSQRARKFSTFNEMEISPDEPQRRQPGWPDEGLRRWEWEMGSDKTCRDLHPSPGGPNVHKYIPDGVLYCFACGLAVQKTCFHFSPESC